MEGPSCVMISGWPIELMPSTIIGFDSLMLLNRLRSLNIVLGHAVSKIIVFSRKLLSDLKILCSPFLVALLTAIRCRFLSTFFTNCSLFTSFSGPSGSSVAGSITSPSSKSSSASTKRLLRCTVSRFPASCS